MKACNQHEVCQTMPKLTLCVYACVREEKKLLGKTAQASPQGKEQAWGDSKTTVVRSLWLGLVFQATVIFGTMQIQTFL